MPQIPQNFDGDKFVVKFNFPTDARIDNGILICPSLPNLTEADLADCIVDMDAYNQRHSDEANAKEQIKTEYQSTINTLQQIEDAQSPTNAQVVAGVKFLAKTLRLLLRLLARRYT